MHFVFVDANAFAGANRSELLLFDPAIYSAPLDLQNVGHLGWRIKGWRMGCCGIHDVVRFYLDIGRASQ